MKYFTELIKKNHFNSLGLAPPVNITQHPEGYMFTMGGLFIGSETQTQQILFTPTLVTKKCSGFSASIRQPNQIHAHISIHLPTLFSSAEYTGLSYNTPERQRHPLLTGTSKLQQYLRDF